MSVVTDIRPRPGVPHNLDAEREALGKCLLDPSLLLECGLEEQDFFAAKHRHIWAALLWLRADGETIDTVHLGDRLDRMGRLEQGGGHAYLLDLTDTVPSAVPTALLRRLRHEREALATVNRFQAAVSNDDLPEARRALAAGLELLNGGQSKPTSPIDAAWRTLGELDALDNPPAPRQWLLERPDEETNGATRKGVLAMGKTGLLISPGGVGKTLVLVQLALAVATGRTWLEHFITSTPGRVLIALAEEDVEEIRRRVYSVARAMRLTDEQRQLAAQNIVSMALAGTNVALVESQGGRTTETTMLHELRKKLDASEWRLVILDPLSRFAGGDTEKDNAAATRFIEAAESLCKAPGSPAVLIAHHTAKPFRGPGRPASASANDARGASALKDGVRWVANLEALDGGDARLTVTKSNYGPAGSPIHLTRDFDQGGYLRILTNEERKNRETARSKREADELTVVHERIFVAVEEAPGVSKETLSKTLGIRAQEVRKGVDYLIEIGRIERLGRSGLQVCGSLLPEPSRPSQHRPDPSRDGRPPLPTTPSRPSHPFKGGRDGRDGSEGGGAAADGEQGSEQEPEAQWARQEPPSGRGV